jgi:hypothetical protein
MVPVIFLPLPLVLLPKALFLLLPAAILLFFFLPAAIFFVTTYIAPRDPTAWLGREDLSSRIRASASPMR